jgi:hypothetical protein
LIRRRAAGAHAPRTLEALPSGAICREFREAVSANAETREGRRIGCRLLDDGWTILCRE